jgi:signal peptidase I
MVVNEDIPATAETKPVKKGTDWWAEVKAIFWLVLAVLAFHSFIAKPFYIPSESMMPVLLKGDRLVVSKYPYGWSWVSPSFHVAPRTDGRIFGSLPERGDIVIVTPPGQKADYIKRAIGLPGDELEMIEGQLFINGKPVKREQRPARMVPVDANAPCTSAGISGRTDDGRRRQGLLPPADHSRDASQRPLLRHDRFGLHAWRSRRFREAPRSREPRLPDWATIATNRPTAAVSLEQQGLGGPVPYENIRRACRAHHLLARTARRNI